MVLEERVSVKAACVCESLNQRNALHQQRYRALKPAGALQEVPGLKVNTAAPNSSGNSESEVL
jgi:hypothetical protein